jgi:hypothetical protein
MSVAYEVMTDYQAWSATARFLSLILFLGIFMFALQHEKGYNGRDAALNHRSCAVDSYVI